MPGTEDLLEMEIRRRFARKVKLLPSRREDERHFLCDAHPSQLCSLALCHVLSVRRDFPIQRPRGLLSPEHLRALVAHMRACMAMTPAQPFSGFRFDAAGSESPTFRRLGAALEAELGLSYDQRDGDFAVTARPGDSGWEILCRVGGRPLSARPWRRVNYRGSLNANLAAAMVELSEPRRHDRFLNVMCGSGTMLIERVQRTRLVCAWGVDNSALALNAARTNSQHAEVQDRIGLLRADARDLPFPSDYFHVVCADLPWGATHGKRSSNTALYRGTLDEALRVVHGSGKLIILTHDTESLEALGEHISRSWDMVAERTFVQRGFRPVCRVYVRRRDREGQRGPQSQERS